MSSRGQDRETFSRPHPDILLHHLRKLPDPLVHRIGVAVFDQDADLVLGAGVANELAAGVAEGRVGFLHELLEAGEFDERRLGGDLEVDQLLRELAHAGGEFGEGGFLFLHDAQHLERAEDAVAGGGVIGEDEVAGTLATEGAALFAEGLDDVAVADRGGEDLDAGAAHGFVQAEVAHHGAGHPVAAEFSLLVERQGGEGENAVAGNWRAGGVGENHAVGIAVEGDAEVGAVLADQIAGGLRVKRPAPVVDVDAVRLAAVLDDFRAEFLENERGDEIGRAMAAIDDDFQAVREILSAVCLANSM